jgi:hypothetical protein
MSRREAMDEYEWEVMEGRWGTRYSGVDGRRARKTYRRAVQNAIAQNRPVTVCLFRDGVCVREFDVAAYGRGLEVS